MAKLQIFGIDELSAQFEALGSIAKPAAKMAVYKAAGVVADQAKSNLKSVLSGNSSGQLYNDLGITPMGDDGGVINVRIGFDGYDSNGVPNALKANVLESGKSNQKKRPFMRPAVRQKKTEALKVMEETFDKEISKITKGK